MTRFVLELFRRSVVAEKGGGRRGGGKGARAEGKGGSGRREMGFLQVMTILEERKAG